MLNLKCYNSELKKIKCREVFRAEKLNNMSDV